MEFWEYMKSILGSSMVVYLLVEITRSTTVEDENRHGRGERNTCVTRLCACLVRGILLECKPSPIHFESQR